MNSLFKLLLIASVLALLVAFPVDAKKKTDLKEKKADEHKAEAAGEVNEQNDHTAEHNVHKEDDQEHQRDDGHKEGTEDDLEHKEDVEHDDEHDTISELKHLGEPPSTEATEAEHENAHSEKEHDHKHVDHEEDKHELKDTEKLNCCFINLQKPLSASSRCSCSQWLKHALRHSIFFRPFYELIRTSLSALPQMGHHHDDNEGEGDKDEEEGEESGKRSSFRELGFFDGGYPGSGYYGGYPGYWGGYPGYYGYSGLGGSPGIGFGIYI